MAARSEHPFDLKGRRVSVLGERGMLGAALLRRLANEGCEIVSARPGTDLRDPRDTHAFFEETRPDVVFLAAATVGGIAANGRFPANFLYDNLMIAANVLEAARLYRVDKLLFVGSSSAYPPGAPQPIAEESLLTGPLDAAHEWNATAKIAGVQLVRAYRAQYGCDFISAMPCNLYGPWDSFAGEGSHVVPALIRRAHEAKRVGDRLTVWGTGNARREFLFVDDCAAALVHLMVNYSDALQVNIGPGDDVSIAELARHVAEVVGFEGLLEFDATKPDGPARRRTDVSKLAGLGWRATTSLREGLTKSYETFLARQSDPSAQAEVRA